MGRDLTLYPRKASKSDLSEYLEQLGFARCEHLWDWPKGTLNYSWFDHEDFKSIDGVSADIYPLDGDELQITGNPWALHVRNVYSASLHDVKMLNHVLKGARKEFGGTIQGDYGTNRYAELWEDTSTPISRGVSGVYQRVDKELSALKFALPDTQMNHPLPLASNSKGIRRTIELVQRFDPIRVIYNGLIPFAVSMFEHFFSNAFRVLIAYDGFALEKRKSHKMKVDFSKLLEVNAGSRSVEDIIVSEYSFQNLKSINRAYKDWLDIDTNKIFFQRKKIGRRIGFLEKFLDEIIERRHGLVHRFELDRSLDKQKYIEILDAITLSVELFARHVEKKYGIEIARV